MRKSDNSVLWAAPALREAGEGDEGQSQVESMVLVYLGGIHVWKQERDIVNKLLCKINT